MKNMKLGAAESTEGTQVHDWSTVYLWTSGKTDLPTHSEITENDLPNVPDGK